MIRGDLILGALVVYLMLGLQWAIICFVVLTIVFSVFDGKPNPKHMPKKWRKENGFDY